VAIYGRGGKLAGQFQGEVEIDGDLTVSGDVQLLVPQQDCAEDFEMSGAEDLGPGSVVVIDSVGALKQRDKAYDRRVAGVISGARDFRPGIILGRQQSHEDNRCRLRQHAAAWINGSHPVAQLRPTMAISFSEPAGPG
jgi:hypothetical protein